MQLTCDGHLIVELDNDAAGEELAGEVEQVRVVEQDQELGEPSLVERHGGIVHESAVLCRGRTRTCVQSLLLQRHETSEKKLGRGTHRLTFTQFSSSQPTPLFT